ncbi:PP2C family protein-serine/threonine phosphatase [Nonomuraea roseoviolacea subsp. roseoviolacea]|uniref:PP2C family protein-serine/threonine phosphatase n=1 Tax=Nonomuraea roseoviolacea TaxID=103837 RepID=UPI0031D899D1
MTGTTSEAEHGPAGTVWQSAPYPVLLVGGDGVIEHVNDAARALPAAAPGVRLADAVPAWLADAHRLVTEAQAHRLVTEAQGHPLVTQDVSGLVAPVRGLIGDRAFEAHPTPGDGGSGVTWWLVDATDHERVSEALRLERRRTAFLAEASNELLSSLNLDRCMEVTVRLAARHLADAALVILPAAGRRHPVAYCGPDGRVVRENPAVDPREVPGLAEALRGFPPVPSRWIDPASAPGWLARKELGEPGSMVVTALPGHGVPAGALVLLRRSGHASFSEGEEVFARLFAARAGAAMSAARLYAEQAAITETLMRELLPPEARGLDGVELSARYRPAGATELVGGDFYDLHPAAEPGGESLLVLGDVCGKGLEAAVFTGRIRTTLHALLPVAGDHGRLLGLLNDVLLRGDRRTFVTLVLASVRRGGPRVTVRLTSAGHPPPLVLRADGRVEEVPTRGTLIGMLETVTATTVTVELEPGDTCLIYTDGVTEARGGPLGDELFGEQRLREELEQCAGMPPEALTERVQMLAAQWTGGGDQDDVAVIAITAPRAGRETTLPGLGRESASPRAGGGIS